MTVTAVYAAEHMQELIAAAAQGDEVSIAAENGILLDLRARSAISPIDESGLDVEAFIGRPSRTLGTGVDRVGPDFWKRWKEIERDWDENVIPNLWMNRDDE